MKQCPDCKIVFHHPERQRCLYCESRLIVLDAEAPMPEDALAYLSTSDDPAVVLSNDTKHLEEAIRIKESLTLSQDKIHNVIGGYLQSRTFHFFYSLSRNELKMGKTYKRFFVHPWNFSFLLNLPWAAVNLVDSALFHLRYKTYCPMCKWKFAGGGAKHDPKECAYNREYTLIINAILTGFIGRMEPTFQAQALAEVKRGEKSAYMDLCTRQNTSEKVWDTVAMWFSIALLAGVALAIFVPLTKQIITSLQNYEAEEIE